MSYTDDNQNIEKPLQEIYKGINDFSNAVDKRIESGGWQEVHLIEINELRNKLSEFKIQILKQIK